MVSKEQFAVKFDSLRKFVQFELRNIMATFVVFFGNLVSLFAELYFFD
jgi:hypothetical protein